MKLIQAKVSDEVFKSFSHYLVDHDVTVSECITGWVEKMCNGDSGAGAKATKAQVAHERKVSEVQVTEARTGGSSPPTGAKPVHVEHPCKICGKETGGGFLCKEHAK